MDHSSLSRAFFVASSSRDRRLCWLPDSTSDGIGFGPCPAFASDIDGRREPDWTRGSADASIDDLDRALPGVLRRLHAALQTGRLEVRNRDDRSSRASSRRSMAASRSSIVYKPAAGGRCPEGLAPPACGRAGDDARRLARGKRTPGGRVHRCVRDSRRRARRASCASRVDSGRPRGDRRRRPPCRRDRPPRGQPGRAAASRAREAGPVRDLEAVAKRTRSRAACARPTRRCSRAGKRAPRTIPRSGPRWPASRATNATCRARVGRRPLDPGAARSRSPSPRPRSATRGDRTALGAPLAGLPPDGRSEAGLPDEDEEARMAGELGAALV